MTTRLLLLFLTLVLPGVSAATGLQLIRTDTIVSSGAISSIDPLTGSDQHLQGYVLLFEGESAIHVKWLDLRPEIVIPVPALPVKTASHQAGDTLVTYTTLAANKSTGTLTILKIALVDASFSTSSIDLTVPSCLGGVPFDSVVSSLLLINDALGNCEGVIVSTTEWSSSSYGLEPENARCSFAWIIAPDLSQIRYGGRHTQLIPGVFTSSASPQFAGFYNYWYQTWYEYEGPGGWTRDEIVNVNSYLRIYGINDSLVDTLFLRLTHTDTTYAIFAAELSEGDPFQELIYYGIGVPLDNSRPKTHYLGCYNFSTGIPEPIWFLPVDWQTWPMNFMYYDNFSHLLAGFADLTVDGGGLIRLIDCSVGRSTITVQLDRSVAHPIFFKSPLDSSLLFAGNDGDTIFLYRFDLFTDVDDETDPSLPEAFTLSQNYPNPFNASTEIRFSLPRASEITLTIYNLLGQEVKTIASGRYTAGEHRISWDGADHAGNPCASGLYLYRLATDNSTQAKKMLLLK